VCSDISRVRDLESTSKRMKDLYFTSMAHELRTPLNSILPVVRLILDLYSSKLDSRLMNYLQIIHNSSLYLKSLIEDALDLCRLENRSFLVSLSPFDFRKALKEVSDIMEYFVSSKGLRLAIHVSSQVPESILTDSQRYKQIMYNLVGNAIKYTFKG
jgi:signal transduction histidine kinase